MNYFNILKTANYFNKLAQGDFCFFVDMDETLLFSFDIGPVRAKELENDAYVKVVPWGKSNIYGCIKRPHADEFLTELNKLGKVSLVTASPPDYAQAMLAAQDLNKYFDKIYTGADLTGVVKENCEQFFLIDNADISSDVINSKMQMLGVETQLPEESQVYDWSEEESRTFQNEAQDRVAEHHISVADFNGNLNDVGLIKVMNEIKQRLSSSF